MDKEGNRLLLFEARGIQGHTVRNIVKLSVDEYKEFDICQQENFFYGIKNLTEETKGDLHSFADKVDKKTFFDPLSEKHKKPRKGNLNDIVCNEHPKVIPCHQSIIEKFLNSLKGAMMTYGIHGSSDLDANEGKDFRHSLRSH